MAEFKKVMEDFYRMCNTYSDDEHCNDSCPLSSKKNGKHIACKVFKERYIEESEQIIEDWAKKNPIITNRMKAKEIFGHDLNVYCYADAEFRSICDEHCKECPYYKDAEYVDAEGSEK